MVVPSAASSVTNTNNNHHTDGSSIGYGDDGTPSGGVLADLDTWMKDVLQPILMERGLWKQDTLATTTTTTTTASTTTTAKDHPAPSSLKLTIPYRIHPISSSATTTSTTIVEKNNLSHLDSFWEKQGPLTAYRYPQRNVPTQVPEKGQQQQQQLEKETLPYLIAKVVTNQRLTPDDWEQDTRHLRIVIQNDEDEDKQFGILRSGDTNMELRLPYRAGDVVSILPVNAVKAVDRFLSLLPSPLQAMADTYVALEHVMVQDDSDDTTNSFPLGVAYRHWPAHFTLRQWLTYCADFQALPEREDLWALSHYCNVTSHALGADQRDKLRSLSDTSASALYTDYILRNKRSWADVLYDFDSLRTTDSTLTLPALVSLLAPLRPREFSIATSPTVEYAQNNMFAMDLTVAVVEGTTPLGRPYHGLCSKYLARCAVGDTLRVWIRPGSFHQLPTTSANLETPVLYAGAGTGIAPLRGLIQERQACRRVLTSNYSESKGEKDGSTSWETPEILLFGCRKESTDFYYKEEWRILEEEGSLTLLSAFSRDQWHKFYVQQRIRQADPQGEKLLHHLVARQGYLYIAGGAKMARSVKEEIVELLDLHLGGKATKFLAQLQRQGRFRVEAWS